jgi:hypothetical protein
MVRAVGRKGSGGLAVTFAYLWGLHDFIVLMQLTSPPLAPAPRNTFLKHDQTLLNTTANFHVNKFKTVIVKKKVLWMCGENSAFVFGLFSKDTKVLGYVRWKMLSHRHTDTVCKLENVTDKLCFLTTRLCPRHWLTCRVYTGHARAISSSFKPACDLADLRRMETLGVPDLIISNRLHVWE